MVFKIYKMKKNILISLLSLLILSCNSNNNSQEKIVYIDNFKVFESFQMKKDYDRMIEKEVSQEKMALDALASSVNSEKNVLKQAELKKVFFEKKQAFDSKFQELSTKYTNLVYERLNGYIKDFGKNNNYTLILGTTGQGNVMFVDEKIDITKKLLEYVNKQYND